MHKKNTTIHKELFANNKEANAHKSWWWMTLIVIMATFCTNLFMYMCIVTLSSRWQPVTTWSNWRCFCSSSWRTQWRRSSFRRVRQSSAWPWRSSQAAWARPGSGWFHPRTQCIASCWARSSSLILCSSFWSGCFQIEKCCKVYTASFNLSQHY